MDVMDRRVRRTKKSLEKALVEILEQKELHQISIQELVDKADIHRATFYSHYQNVYDLYEQLEKEILTELRELVVSFPSHDYSQLYIGVIRYLQTNPSHCRIIFGSHCKQNLTCQIIQILEEQYLKIWLFEDNKTEITEEMRYLTTYNISGCLAILKRWVDTGFSASQESLFRLLDAVNEAFDRI